MKCELKNGELVLTPEDGTEEYFLITLALANVEVIGGKKTDAGTKLVNLRIGRYGERE